LIQVGVVSGSVGGRCNVVRVRIMIPGSVGAAVVPWPAKVGRPSGVSPRAASGLALGLATGVSFVLLAALYVYR
jgi:hypothetical protein